MHKRKGSIEASGTFTASSSAGFKLGTSLKASEAFSSSVLIPVSLQLSRNWSLYSIVSPGNRTNNPSVGSTHFLPILLRIIFSEIHSLAAS